MKKIAIALFSLFLTASICFAAPFLPNKMKLSAPATVQYQFDGSTLHIPLTLSGVPGTILFSVYTKDQASKILDVTNGFMGWHYVNKIDTCVYVSSPYTFQTGSNTVLWEGKNKDGKAVAAGVYTYYLFGFDSISAKVRVNKVFNPSGKYVTLEEIGEDGNPLANPILHNYGQDRWVIGGDPLDQGLMMTTGITLPSGWSTTGRGAFLPTNFNMFFNEIQNKDAVLQGLAKFQFVPSGQAILQTDFGDNGLATFTANVDNEPGVVCDGNYLITADSNHHLIDPVEGLYIYDFDGNQLKRIDLSPWWSNPNDKAAGGQMNGGPNFLSERNGYVFLDCHCSCIKQMVNPAASLENEEDFLVWTNRNGDYFLDHNEDPTSLKAWVCNDFNVPPEVYSMEADANMFNLPLTNYIGAVSFGVMGPDGIGMGYYAFAGETSSRFGGSETGGHFFCQNGSAYDGIYTDNYTSADSTLYYGTFYIGHDSMKGVISKEVSVNEAAPAAFTVAQNSPNPFNPSTTISFTIAKAGKTTVDVYNVAGQKIDTLVNSNLNAGSHTAVWNAARFSAGVYFYTVKCGDFSKTLKMTLLK